MKINVLDLSITVSILFCYLGVLRTNVSSRLGGPFYILLAYALFAAVFFFGRIRLTKRDRLQGKAFGMFCLFMFVLFFGYEYVLQGSANVSFGPISFTNNGFNILKNFPIWCIGYLLLICKKEGDRYRKLFYWILAYDVLITLLALSAEPSFVKNLTASIITPSSRRFYNMGAMGYGMTYAVVIIVPALILEAKQSKSKLLWLLACVSVYYVFKCSYMIALVAMMLNFVLGAVFSIKDDVKRMILIMTSLLLAVLAIIFSARVGELLISVGEYIDNYALRQRFEQIGDLLAHGDNTGDSLVRFTLYRKSVEGILTDGILGLAIFNPSAVVSGHSTILDTWSLFGIAAVIPLIMSIYYGAKDAMANKSVRGVAFAGYMTYVFIAVFNPVLSEPQIVMTIIWALPMIIRNLGKQNTDLCRSV